MRVKLHRMDLIESMLGWGLSSRTHIETFEHKSEQKQKQLCLN